MSPIINVQSEDVLSSDRATDSLIAIPDSILSPLEKKEVMVSKDAIDQQVTYTATGYIKNDLKNKRSILFGSAQVEYGDIKITADSIVFDMATNDVFAASVTDTSGVITGKPVLEYGNETFESDTIKYNFNTKKAIVKNIVTKQDEGLLHSSAAKMLDDGSSNLYMSTYSTCELDTPHFYIDLRKAKIYPGKKIISGPANLVFEGIPTPLWLPFGFFPIQNKTAESGIILPRYNYEENRGLALTNGGFYIAASDYYDLTLQGSIYTNGTWLAMLSTNYNKRYKYRGSLSLSYANNISGHKGLDDYSKSSNYSIKWTFTQDAKVRPGTSFSANVNMSSSGYDKNNSYDVQEHITTTKTSSISYSKTWAGKPFNFTASMNHNQNSANQTIAMTLPSMSFSISRIYPFKNKNRVGTSKWYEDISLQYTANLSNQINTYDSLMFTSQMFDNMKFGFQHQVPLSLQITPFKNFSITPSLTYRGVMYMEKREKTWDETTGTVVVDTLNGLFYGQALNPSISLGYTPQIFGLFQYKNPNWRLQAIRHVIKPSVTLSYIPYFKRLNSDMYREVQYNASGDITQYSIFEGGIYGTPSLSRKSAVVNLSINNILEAKVKSPSDTTEKASTVKLIDNLSLSSSYDIFADSLRWSPVNMSFRTTLAQKISVSATGRFSLYGLDSLGNTINKYQFSINKKPLRLTNSSLSVSFSLSDLLKQLTKNDSSSSSSESTSGEEDDDGYQKFNMPWSMSVSYSLTYSKPRFDPLVSQTISINGNVTLTSNTSISYRSGYDITNRKLSATQIGISRQLHCWSMSMSWIPVGTLKSWSFQIRVNASMLSDLKYERKKDYHDNY